MPTNASDQVLLGRRLRALRKLRKLTQEKLAERSSLSSKFIGQIERGTANPSFLVMERTAHALGIETYDLLRFEESRPQGPVVRAAGATAARERIAQFLANRPATQIERALKILEAALGQGEDPQQQKKRGKRA